MNGFVEMVKRNIFLSAPGLVVLVILFGGVLKGFNLAHVVGVIGLFVLHHKDELAYILKPRAEEPVFNLENISEELEKFKLTHQREVEALRSDISKANMAIAFKVGKAPEQKP